MEVEQWPGFHVFPFSSVNTSLNEATLQAPQHPRRVRLGRSEAGERLQGGGPYLLELDGEFLRGENSLLLK